MLVWKRSERTSDLAHRDQLFGVDLASDCPRVRTSFHKMRTPPIIAASTVPTYPVRKKPRGDAFWLIHCCMK